MSNNNKALTVKNIDAPVSWGDREEIDAIAKRLKAMLPNGNRMTNEQAFAAAQYAQLTTLDPFSGGFYVIPGGGIHNHYATIAAWAQDKEPFNDKYFPLDADEMRFEGINPDEVIAAWKCYVLKDSKAELLGTYLKAGIGLQDALDLAATRGIGVITKSDTVDKFGKPMSPPKTWTWDKKAQKRALTDALKRSHGKPTAAELRAMSERLHKDSPDARLAALEKLGGQVLIESGGMTPEQHQDRLQDNVKLLRDQGDGDIGEDWQAEDYARFVARVKFQIPFYATNEQVGEAMGKLELEYSAANEDMLFDELARHANEQADQGAYDTEG